MLLAGLCLALWAWCCLSLGLPQHHLAVLRRPPTHARSRWLRIAGWAQLMAGFMWFTGWQGWQLGLIFWSAALVVTAIVWVLLMTLLPRRSLTINTLVSIAAVGRLIAGG